MTEAVRAPDTLRFQLFGYPTLTAGDGRSVALGARATALLAILAIEPMAMRRSLLAQMLWPDRGAVQARASLRQCLVEIRRAGAAYNVDLPIVADPQHVVLPAGTIPTDLAQIERAIEAGDAPSLTHALNDAAPRPLLAELTITGAFQKWVESTRARVERRLELVLPTILDQAAVADAAAARALAKARLSHNPDCPAALAVLRRAQGDGAAPALAPNLRPLPPLRLPSDAPPAVVIPRFTIGDRADREFVALAGAIREEVISGLARFRELRVVSVAESSLARVDLSQDAPMFVLNAALRPSDIGHVLSARLTTSGGDTVLWGERFELGTTGLQPAIDSFVERIVGAVTPTVETHLVRTAGEHPDGQLFNRYLLAKARAQRPAGHAEALSVAAELEAIIAAAPRFAAPRLSLARLYNTDFGWTRAMSGTPEYRDRARALAHEAIALDRSFAHGYTVLGWCHLRRREWGAARRLFDEALRLNPYHAVRLMEIAFGLLHLGDFDAAETLLRRCLAINPVTEDDFLFDLAMLAMVRGDPLAACEHLAMIAEPDTWDRIILALATFQAGRDLVRPRAAARAALAQLWPGGRLPAVQTVRGWMATSHPFRVAAHFERFGEGLPEIFG